MYSTNETDEATTGEGEMSDPPLPPAIAVAAQPAPNLVYVQEQGSVLRPIQKEDEKPASISQWACQSIILTGVLLVFCLVTAAWAKGREDGESVWYYFMYKSYKITAGYVMTAGTITLLSISLILIVSSMIAQCLENYKLSHKLSMFGSVVTFMASVLHFISWIAYFAELFEVFDRVLQYEPYRVMFVATIFMVLLGVADALIRAFKLGPL